MRPRSSGRARKLTSRPRKAKYISGARIYTNQPVRIYLCRYVPVSFDERQINFKLRSDELQKFVFRGAATLGKEHR
ncbi:hypothetical protein J2S14_003172 [Lederbergia wuyishanensis]|uniref:Uncharacterized protein n=1 Tax=Lederbergia wuyishanensis TaxID=1347903 RepID=A0ABU0D7E8_9BACI|nr:hypothetical protein [Lederbergia wuyishanensis]